MIVANMVVSVAQIEAPFEEGNVVAGPLLGLALMMAMTPAAEGWGERTGPAPDNGDLKSIGSAKTVEAFLLGTEPNPRESRPPGPDSTMSGLRIRERARLTPDVAGRFQRALSERSNYAPDTLCWLCTTCEPRTRVGLRFAKGKKTVDVVAFLPESFVVVLTGQAWTSRLVPALRDEFSSLKSLGPAWASAIDAELAAPSERLASPPSDVSGFPLVHTFPEPIEKPLPKYPEYAGQQVEGIVLVKALVNENGRVVETFVTKSVPLLDGPAQAAVREWKFKPATCGGRPKSVWVVVPMKFAYQVSPTGSAR